MSGHTDQKIHVRCAMSAESVAANLRISTVGIVIKTNAVITIGSGVGSLIIIAAITVRNASANMGSKTNDCCVRTARSGGYLMVPRCAPSAVKTRPKKTIQKYNTVCGSFRVF